MLALWIAIALFMFSVVAFIVHIIVRRLDDDPAPDKSYDQVMGEAEMNVHSNRPFV